MQYEHARQLIETGDIVFFRGHGLKDKLIRAFYLGKYDHVGVAVVERIMGERRVLICEETPKGSQLSNMSIRTDTVEIFRPVVPEGIKWDAVSELVINTGAAYSFWNAVIVGLNLPRFMQETRKAICSEAVADYMYDMGIWTHGDTLLHPQDLYDCCADHDRMENITREYSE